MKKTIAFLVLALFVGVPALTSAMTLDDVLQQYEIYKNTPQVLGATSSTDVVVGCKLGYKFSPMTGEKCPENYPTPDPSIKNPAEQNSSVKDVKPLPKEETKILMKGLEYAKGSSSIISRPIKEGMESCDDVKALQLFLILKKHLSVDAPTCYFGPKTREALKKFQMEKGIMGGDGSVVGPKTRDAIKAEVESTTKTTN